MSDDAFRPFFFLHFGDPQIGMGSDGIEGDASRFLQAVRQANRLQPPFVLVSGDLTNRRQPEEYEALDRGLAALEPPAKLVPGNHDLSGPEDLAGLENYRRRFGADFYRFAHENCEFLCLNSMTLTAGPDDPSPALEESERQWRWLEKSLADARERERAHLFLFMHVPPFLNSPDEPKEYFNLPPEPRMRLLDLARRFEARLILAGHTHKTAEIRSGGFTIHTIGGTSVVFDDRGWGYRIFKVFPNRVEQEYVRLDGPAPEAVDL